MCKNKKYKEIIVEKMQVKLEEVNYKAIPTNSDKELELAVKLKGNSKIVEINDEYFVIKHTRELSFEPKAMFNILVQVSIKMYYDIHKMKDFKDKEDFKNYMKADADLVNLINETNIGSSISLLMSNLTSSFNGNPLIVPPILENN